MLLARSKNLISSVLSNLTGNFIRTQDPLGFKSVYWTDWSAGLNLSHGGETILYTARIYQMLPYILATASLVEQSRYFLSRKGLDRLVNLGNRVAGEALVSLKAKRDDTTKIKGQQILQGISAALSSLGVDAGYLDENEPYSGVLLHDLGLEELVRPHARKVYALFKQRGVRRVICLDPHTAYMLKEVFPLYIKDYDLEVRHYLEFLTDRVDDLARAGTQPKEEIDFVIHDSCLLARNLFMADQVRLVAGALGLSLQEPPSSKKDTACCGGPIEYAFSDMSRRVSNIRIKELAAVSPNILVSCPICLINLARYEKELGIKVWDLGEILFSTFRHRLAQPKF